MKKQEKSVLVGFRVTKALKKKIQLACIKEERTSQALITRAVNEYLETK